MENQPTDHVAGLLRTGLAVLALLLFWSGIGYGLRPKPCLLAVPGSPVFRGLCRQLENEQ